MFVSTPTRVASGIAIVLAAALGCRPASVEVPRFSPAASAKQAIRSCDKNGDQLLDSEELRTAPGLAALLKTADKNGDGKLGADEIQQRISQLVTDNVAYLPLRLQLFLDERPLGNAEVKLIPEPCLGEVLVTAQGTTNGEGIAAPLTERSEFGGVQCGLYRIVITKKGNDGSEQIPAKYNRETSLGLEVSLGNRDLERPIILKLTGS